MQLRLEKRSQPSQLLRIITPIGAVLLTMVLGAIVFTLLGYDGVGAVREIFISPLVNSYKWQDLAVKAAPLIIIAVGLAISYRANVWNIGAEGQYIVGAVVGTGVGLATNTMTGWWIMPLMMLAGAAGGAAYAAVPALLRVRFRVNEILTTLMFTYVAVYILNYLVFGPWKSPTSMGQPQTVMFSADQSLPYIIPGTIVQLNAPIAIVAALVAWLFFSRFVFGFQIRVVGAAPHAARYGGFSADRTICMALLISGGLAGFAGILEAMGPFGRLVPQFPTNYGFTAIIVAFLGRLHPIGVVLAGLIVALSFVGGEMAQISIKLPFAAVGIFQAMMLFLLLASDILVRYRVRAVRPGEVAA
jgi:simple sugar transport system permease protein